MLKEKDKFKLKEVMLKRFLGKLLKKGKKGRMLEVYSHFLAGLRVYALSIDLEGGDPFYILWGSIQNVSPEVVLYTKKVGKRKYKIPRIVKETSRSYHLGMKHLIEAAKKKSDYKFYDCLMKEVIDGYNKRGGAFNKKRELYRLALENRPYLKFV